MKLPFEMRLVIGCFAPLSTTMASPKLPRVSVQRAFWAPYNATMAINMHLFGVILFFNIILTVLAMFYVKVSAYAVVIMTEQTMGSCGFVVMKCTTEQGPLVFAKLRILRDNMFNKGISIAANCPEFFIIIRKSKLEYKFPNNWFCFRIMKIYLFFLPFFFTPCSVDDSTSTCCNQHSRVFSDFALQRMCCRLQFTSRSCACVPFSSASGGTPPSRTLPH